MYPSYPVLTLLQLVVAVLVGAIAAFLSIALFDLTTRDIDEWEELRKGNAAVGIILGAIVVSIAWILRPALRMPIGSWDVGALRVVAALAVEATQLLAGLVLAVLAVVFALWLFARLTTRLDEWAEIKRGNVAVASLLAGVILAVSLLTSTAIDSILQLITPYLF